MSSPSPAVPTPLNYAFTAKTFNSQFAYSAATYNALSVASDGNVYYAISTEVFNVGVQMYRYNPVTDTIAHLADLTKIVGEENSNAVVQGKVHVNFHELNGKLYFSTHLGFYDTTAEGREIAGTPPAGVGPYPGGHFLSYDLKTEAFEDFGIPVRGEGLIAVALDTRRGLLYGLTWPSGLLVAYNLASKAVTSLGPTSLGGEAGDGPTYRALCRSLALDLETGDVYLTTSDGSVVRACGGVLSTLPPDVSFNRQVLGTYDLTVPGELGYNWRQTIVHEDSRTVFGVHGRTGMGLRFEIAAPSLEFLNRLTSLPTRKSGAFDVPRHGYLSFGLGPDGDTIFYLTGAHISLEATEKEQENVHLITYHISTAVYVDHGAIGLDTGGAPADVNSIAVAEDGLVYALSRIEENGGTRYDLIRFNSGLYSIPIVR